MVVGRHYKLTYQEDWLSQGVWPPKAVGASWVGEFQGETEDGQYRITAERGGGALRKDWVYEILELPVGHPTMIQSWQWRGNR